MSTKGIYMFVAGRILLLSILTCLVSCEQRTSVSSTSTGVGWTRTHDAQVVAEGERIYMAHCVTCHGEHAEGDKNWRKRGADGLFPPPPLNGSGHAWHHSKLVLKNIIVNGSAPGQGNMPAWKGKLTNAQIDAVIEWFQSRWSDEVYAAWHEMQSASH